MEAGSRKRLPTFLSRENTGCGADTLVREISRAAPVLDFQSFHPLKNSVTTDQHSPGGYRVRSDHHVEIAHRRSLPLHLGPYAGILLRTIGVPREHLDPEKKLLNCQAELRGRGRPRHTEA